MLVCCVFIFLPLNCRVIGLYLQKTRQILSSVRDSTCASSGPTQGKAFIDQLNGVVASPMLRSTKGGGNSSPTQNKALANQLNAAIGSPNLRSTGFVHKPMH